MFVEQNAKYLDQWITLVGIAMSADMTGKNVKRLEADNTRKITANKKENERIKDKIRSDNLFLQAFKDIYLNDSPEERSKWNVSKREVHNLMVNSRYNEVSTDLSNSLLQRERDELTTQLSQYDILKNKLNKMEIFHDPDQLNKYNEAIDEMIKEMAANDQRLEESLRKLDEIEGQIAQLDNAPGAVRAREVAIEQAGKTLKTILQDQETTVGNTAKEIREGLMSLGILTKEEEEIVKRQREEDAARIDETVKVEDQDGQVLYN